MRRVVVTGMGIVSPIGNSVAEALQALREGRSGVEFIPEMRALGLRCHVAGRVRGLDTTRLGKRPLQTMSDVAKYAAVAALEAIEDARVGWEALRSPRVGFGPCSSGVRRNPACAGADGTAPADGDDL
jgi:3-oxoacyl-[acyl-carrier-protein] synthase I